MDIENGWSFLSADFSVQSCGKSSASGIVTLVRSPSEKDRWHKMPDDVKDVDNNNCPPLFVIGHGMTLKEAIINANIAAINAKPIISE